MTTMTKATTESKAYTLWIGTEPDPNDRLQIDVSEVDFNRVPIRGRRGSVTLTDLRTNRLLTVRRASCGIESCFCALELVAWADEPQPECATKFDRVFAEMSAPDYPATCNQCGLEGTNASMERHECDSESDSTYLAPDEWKQRHGYAVESVTQPEQTPDRHSPLPWRDNRTNTRYEILDAEGDSVLRINGGMIPTEPSAALLLAEVNNHAQLVAALEDELEAIRVWQSQSGYEWRVPSGMREGLAISADKIQSVLSRVRG